MIKIDPTANTIDGRTPCLGIGNHGFAGFFDVIFKRPLGANITTVGNTKLLFDEVLGGKTVAVPTPATFDAVAIHGPKTRNGIFHDGAKKSAMMGIASNKWWAIIENIRFILWALFYGLFESFILLPPITDGFFVFDGFSSLTGLIFHVGSFN